MANYTVQEALQLDGLSEGAKAYLNRLSKSGIDKISGKTFNATSKTALKSMIESIVASKDGVKEVTLDDCLKVVRSLVKGTKKERRLISPKDLLPKLEELKTKLEAEKKFSKVDKLVASSGMTKEQLIEYLKG
jgi:hypothetical protein